MAWISMFGKKDATGELAEVYERVSPGEAAVDNVLAIHSLHPRTMTDHFELYKTLMYRPGPLTRRERELIALAVSADNACHY